MLRRVILYRKSINLKTNLLTYNYSSFSESSISSAAIFCKSPFIETKVKATIKIKLDKTTVIVSNFVIPRAIANINK